MLVPDKACNIHESFHEIGNIIHCIGLSSVVCVALEYPPPNPPTPTQAYMLNIARLGLGGNT